DSLLMRKTVLPEGTRLPPPGVQSTVPGTPLARDATFAAPGDTPLDRTRTLTSRTSPPNPDSGVLNRVSTVAGRTNTLIPIDAEPGQPGSGVTGRTLTNGAGAVTNSTPPGIRNSALTRMRQRIANNATILANDAMQ